MPGEFERIVSSHAVGEIVGDQHREVGGDDEFIEAPTRLRAAEKFSGAIDGVGECAVCKGVSSDDSFAHYFTVPTPAAVTAGALFPHADRM